MRIGLFTDTYPPYINGVSTSVSMLRDALEKKGIATRDMIFKQDVYQYR